MLARAADWFRLFEGQNGPVEREDAPSAEAVKDLACLPRWEGVPPLDAVVECPVLSRGGSLVQTPGYHPEARLWYTRRPTSTCLRSPRPRRRTR